MVYGLPLNEAGTEPRHDAHPRRPESPNAFSFLWVEAGVLITGSLNQSDNQGLAELVFPAVRVLREGGGFVDHSH